MKELEMLREKFRNREMRWVFYLVALIMNVINMRILIQHMYGRPLSHLVIPLIISGGITLALYYVTDTWSTLITVTLFAAKIGKTFAALMGMLTVWMLGLGFLIQLMLTVMTYFMVIAGGAMFAYLFPIVFIPLFVVCGKLIKKFSGTEDSKEQAQNQTALEANVDWDHIYDGVMSAVKTSK